tara:strand:- start:181 stop:495 length:315 start_codon:yes stop_codon:yes gene_type:complete
MKKQMILATLILSIFTTSVLAAEFEAPTLPKEVLSQQDLNLIDGAIASDFKGLSKADKKKLKGFLIDYKTSVKRQKNATSKSGSKKGTKKRKGITKYKSGSIIN